MSRGSINDFTSKYGFDDGGSTEPRDYQARDAICRGLNKLMRDHVAIPFDRPGMHNPCLIIFAARKDGVSPEQHLRAMVDCNENAALPSVALRDLPRDFDVSDLIQECYDEIDEGIDGEPYGQFVVDSFVDHVT